VFTITTFPTATAVLLFSAVPTAPQNVVLTFGLQSPTFDPDSQILNTTVNVSWVTPLEPNGVITNYFVNIYSSDDVMDNVISETAVAGNVVSSQFMVSVSPYVQYRASVRAATSEGSSDTEMSAPQFSPEAGMYIVRRFSHIQFEVPIFAVVLLWVHHDNNPYPRQLIFSLPLRTRSSERCHTVL
jgi:hypothetical protein